MSTSALSVTTLHSAMTVRTTTTDDTGYEGGTEGSDVDTLGLNWDEEAARGGAVMDTNSSMVSTITYSCDANYSTTTNNNNNNEITDDNIKKSYCNDRNVDEAKESALEHDDKPRDDYQDDTTHQYHGHAAEDDTADGVILLDEQDEESSEQTTSNCPGAYHVPGPGAVVAWTGDDLSTATPLTSTGTPLTSTRGDTPSSLATGTPSSVMATQGHVNAALRAADRMRQNSIDNELDRLGIHRVDAEAVPISEAVPLSEDGINSSGNDEQQQQEIVYDAEPVTPKRTLKILGLEVPTSTLVWIALGVIPMSTLLIGLMVAVNNKDDDQQLPAVVEEADPNSFDEYNKCMSLVGDSAKCNFKDCMLQFKDVKLCDHLPTLNDLGPPPGFPLIGPLSSEEAFRDPASPQYQAKEWMIGEDNVPPAFQEVQWIQERYILAVLYFSMGGNDWYKSEGIVGSQNHCTDTPETVICDDNNRIVELRLGNNNLHGTIPEEIQHLPFLRHLSLENNYLEGTMPSVLGLSLSLEEMWVQDTNITGSLDFLCQSSRSSTLDIKADIDEVDCECCTCC